MNKPLRLGVSACLLGEHVRYDGGHKRDDFVADTLAREFQLVPICPEMGIGLGVPRPPIQLEGDPRFPRAVGVTVRDLDVTDALLDFGRRAALEFRDMSGSILKSRSPSCGVESAPMHLADGTTERRGRGLFAQALMRALPLLPVEEEGRLADPLLRESFLERVYACDRWQALLAAGLTPAALIAFHAGYKLVLMAHSPGRYRALGQMVAEAGTGPLEPLAQTYAGLFMNTLSLPATVGKHANALQHLAGYLKKVINRKEKAELQQAIDGYRAAQLSRAVPLALLQDAFRRHPHPYAAEQVYLHPPAAMMELSVSRSPTGK